MHSLYCAKWPNTLKVVNPELHSKGDRKRGLEEGKAFILDLLVEFETLVDGESIHQSAIVEMQTGTPSKRLFPKYGPPSAHLANRLCRADLRRGMATPQSALGRLRQSEPNLGRICYDK